MGTKETGTMEPRQSTMEIFIEHVEAQLPINVHRLHTECSNQPALYAEVGKAVMEARLSAKRHKIGLEELKAVVDADVRAHPEQHGLEKTTEACIASAVTRAASVQEETQVVMLLDHEASLLGVLLGALDQRRSMLTAEVDLYIGNYFGNAKFGEENANGTRKQMRDKVEEKGKEKKGKK